MGILETFAVPHPPILIPGVGKGEEHGAQATIDAYRTVARRIAELAPETIILTTSHGDLRRRTMRITTGSSTWGDFSQFGDPADRLETTIDEELTSTLIELAEAAALPLEASPEPGNRLDHGCLVPLYFIAQELKTPFKIVRVGISFVDDQLHFRMGQCISQAVEKLGRQTVFVASGDLSHRLKPDGPYGFDPAGPVFDQALCEAFSAGDLDALMHFDTDLREQAGECGLSSFVIMAGALDGRPMTPELLSYEGPWGVGYGIARFTPLPSLPVRLAFAALEDWLAGVRRPAAATPAISTLLASLDSARLDELEGLRAQQAGAFVSFHIGSELRGCIGTIEATCENVFEEICQNTVSAAARDPRFPAIRNEELPLLSCSVDVLGQAEPVTAETPLDEKRYGVIVSLGARRGLLLPDLEGVESPEEQISIALRKAGIAPDEPYYLERFEVVRHT